MPLRWAYASNTLDILLFYFARQFISNKHGTASFARSSHVVFLILKWTTSPAWSLMLTVSYICTSSIVSPHPASILVLPTRTASAGLTSF